MGHVESKLKQTLNELDISGNQLAVESSVRSNTIYDLINNNSKSVNFNTLSLILDTLNRLAKDKNIPRRISIEDIITYKN